MAGRKVKVGESELVQFILRINVSILISTPQQPLPNKNGTRQRNLPKTQFRILALKRKSNLDLV